MLTKKIDFIVYTALTGNYEYLNELGEFEKASNTAYFCFTENNKLRSTNWKIHYVQSNEPPIQLSRTLKMMIPSHFPDSTILCYKDNSVVLKRPISRMAHEMLGDFDIVFFSHSQRRTILGEFVVCESYRKDDPIEIRKHFRYILESDHSCLFKKPMWGGLFVLRVNDKTREFLRLWHDSFNTHSKRDQLSLISSLRASRVNYGVIKRSNQSSEWHSWPIELGRKKKLSLLKRVGVPYRIAYLPRILKIWLQYFFIMISFATKSGLKQR